MDHHGSEFMRRRSIVLGLLIVLTVYAVASTAWTRASRGELGITLHAGDR